MKIPKRIQELLLGELRKSDKEIQLKDIYFDVKKISEDKYEVIATHKSKRISKSISCYAYQIGLDSLKFIIDRDISKRSKDENGFLHIKDNPIAKSGVFPYLKREVEKFREDDPEGDEIVQVYRDFQDLANNKDLFANKPIIHQHEWVGKDGTRSTISGVIGNEVRIQEPYLIADLIIYDKDLISMIENNEIVELSPGYQCDIIEKEDSYLDQRYDYCQVLKSVNHLAVVERGRSGRDLKILDSENLKKMKGVTLMKILDFLSGRFRKAQDQGVDLNSSNLVKIEDEETRANPKLEKFYSPEKNCIIKVSDNKVEIETKDQDDKSEKDDKSAAKDQDVKSEKDVKDEDNKSEKDVKDEDNKSEKDVKDEDDKSEGDSKKTEDSLIKSLVEKEVSKIEEKYARLADAYNQVKNVLGSDFDYSGMNASDIYAHGYQCLTSKKISDHMDSKTAFLVAAENMKTANTPKFEDSSKNIDESRISSLMSILR